MIISWRIFRQNQGKIYITEGICSVRGNVIPEKCWLLEILHILYNQRMLHMKLLLLVKGIKVITHRSYTVNIPSYWLNSKPSSAKLHVYKMYISIELLPVHCYIVIILFPQIIAFDELKTDYKNPIDQCNTLNPVSDATASDTPSLPLWLHADMLCWKFFIFFILV